LDFTFFISITSLKKRAIAEYLKQHPLESVADAPKVETSAQTKATAAKTKTKQIRGKTK